MFIKAVTAFLLLPTMVAFVVPQIINQNSQWNFSEQNTFGLILLLLGSSILISCVVIFYTSGKGTLAPWNPPKHLVQTGLYKYSRNPMYVGVLLIMLGWTLYYGSWNLMIYSFIFSVAFNIRVKRFEEPWLLENFGESWLKYKSEVRRWI
ncbi:MAG: isoprenylcysteine carboxylmethyltransferase family protein [Saprospiraceae bacterium]|nr:isoprenylcysteine carboxylmethyltransferase family protein [Saprospiraceae bacterium]